MFNRTLTKQELNFGKYYIAFFKQNILTILVIAILNFYKFFLNLKKGAKEIFFYKLYI